MAKKRTTGNQTDDDRTAPAGEAAAPQNSGDTSDVPTQAQIAECAYFIWLAKGSPSGQDDACWHEAEQQLRSNRTLD